MPYWYERVAEMATQYPDIKVDKYHIDILTAQFVLHPDWFDIVVASNLFGDILSDLGPDCTGTIGIAPSGNINPEGKLPWLFEPVHGPAPDIAVKGIANPIGQIWAAAMMLEHLGAQEASASIVTSIERVLSEEALRTPDLGGPSVWCKLVARYLSCLVRKNADFPLRKSESIPLAKTIDKDAAFPSENVRFREFPVIL